MEFLETQISTGFQSVEIELFKVANIMDITNTGH